MRKAYLDFFRDPPLNCEEGFTMGVINDFDFFPFHAVIISPKPCDAGPDRFGISFLCRESNCQFWILEGFAVAALFEFFFSIDFSQEAFSVLLNRLLDPLDLNNINSNAFHIKSYLMLLEVT